MNIRKILKQTKTLMVPTVLLLFFLLSIFVNSSVEGKNINDANSNYPSGIIIDGLEVQNIISNLPMKSRPFDSYKKFRDNLRNKLFEHPNKNREQTFRPTVRVSHAKASRNCFFSPIQCQLNVKKLNDMKDPSFQLFKKRPNTFFKKNLDINKSLRLLVLS
uniref:Uncharacterized protein n=1 Tax=Parastrongyloides trichosuri TaxID=131310 RepID=A0A0N4ZSR0_PARTI